jgi:RHH-type proline utilization regulon transcriptional repressor/proline dehydrogenase/delta 1-pyrroline-5-carboxylate dehydrogenase
MNEPALVASASSLADALLHASSAQTTRAERRRAERLGRLLADPGGRELLFTLTDEVLRATDDGRAVDRLRRLVAAGLPSALGALDRAALRLAAIGGRAAPRLVAPVVRARVKAETRGVILPAHDPPFARHLASRRADGVESNVNLLGEAILGDDEADARLDAVCRLLRRSDVTCVSVKASALCANLDVLAFDQSVDRIVDRLQRVYRVAAASQPAKFVYLDMEEYRDLHLTVVAFRTVLDQPEFRSLPAGIALQAYIPDSFAVLDELCEWASARRVAGGATTRVRIVKGANLAMEQVEAELMGWPQAPYDTKEDVDAHYKRMLDRSVDAAMRGDMHVGVGSHNLFDIAWALALRASRGLGNDNIEIEMLEGMAPAQARTVHAIAGALLLYTPVVDDTEYAAAIAYLSRRLDENAAEENFLRALFSITPGSARWHTERKRFEAAVARRRDVSTMPRRTQDRRTERRVFDPEGEFRNEPDTDFTLPANRAWIAYHLASDVPPPPPPLLQHTDDVDAAVMRARNATRDWAATSTAERRRVLTRAAEVMAANRGRAMAVMAHETAKTVREGDPEASEAIDMARWAATHTRLLEDLANAGVRTSPVGVVVVAAPWNFPYAIPANGVLSALAAGNTVLLKPAPEAVAVGVELVRELHEAGVPPDVVQLVRAPDNEVGRHLITHDGIDTVVLTGAYDTARLFLDWKPRLRLIAETSGKNALVVTGGADLDLAIRDIVRSAFGHSGQKCSAASLAILEASLCDDDRFLGRIADAVRSVRVGAATDLTTMMGPLIAPPTGKLRRALTQLDAGERWLVEPKQLDERGALWSPGVKLGVAPGSWFHRTECFGPVLGVMRARDLDDALALQNAPEFGLTGGLHSLDPDEIEHWLDRVEAGNVYINRHTTGAIVRRQPFGGWKHSSVGPGAKTGGPNDILRFVRFGASSQCDGLDPSAIAATDPAGLHAETNTLRYRPLTKVVVRASSGLNDDTRRVLETAARVTGVEHEISDAHEADATLAQRIGATGAQRLRTLGPIGDELARACHESGITIDDTAVTSDARVELPRWLREQAISRTMHRHGRVAAAPSGR